MVVEDKIGLKKGLRDVYFDRSAASFIDGKEGKLLYRGYNIHDLAEHSTFEETSYLLLYGSLPTRLELQEFDDALRANRHFPDEVLAVIRLSQGSHPMDLLRTAVSVMSSSDRDLSDLSRETTLRRGLRLTAAVPTIVAAHARIRQGQEAVAPRSDLGHAENFLYMLFDEVPDADDARLIDKDLVLHAEHGVNASTFAVRVAASTRADFYAAMTAGVSVLKGPLHGGAAEGVWKLAQDVGSEENAERYIDDLLKEGGRVMGFGHPVYKTVDPRSVHLKADAKALAERKGQPRWFSILQAVVETRAMQRRARLGVRPNVDFWAGAVYHLLGIAEDLFISLFTMGRIPGWVAHLVEQYSKSDILRPRLLYDGPTDLEYVPIDQRG